MLSERFRQLMADYLVLNGNGDSRLSQDPPRFRLSSSNFWDILDPASPGATVRHLRLDDIHQPVEKRIDQLIRIDCGLQGEEKDQLGERSRFLAGRIPPNAHHGTLCAIAQYRLEALRMLSTSNSVREMRIKASAGRGS